MKTIVNFKIQYIFAQNIRDIKQIEKERKKRERKRKKERERERERERESASERASERARERELDLHHENGRTSKKSN
jgi:hypothetical protein